MIGIRGAVVIVLVAEEAIGRSAGILPANVAQVARNRLMGTRQWEIGIIVVERRRAPGGGRVAHGAVVWESKGNMIGISHPVVVFHVA